MEIFVLYENCLNLNRIFRDCVIRRVYINYIQSKKCDWGHADIQRRLSTDDLIVYKLIRKNIFLIKLLIMKHK